MQLLVIQHDHASPLGPVAERFVDRGFDLTMHLVVSEASFLAPGVRTEFPDFTHFDAVVAMGAPWSAYDEVIGTWVRPEIEQLRRADEVGVPVLGICFGGQLLAAAHGGSVTVASSPEIGWTDVDSDDDALVPSGRWFQWHYDRWELPPAAVELARNPASSQAFALRRNLAVQFHPELSSTMLDGWLKNGGATKAAAAGIDPVRLMDQTRELEADARLRANRLVDGFLDSVATRRS